MVTCHCFLLVSALACGWEPCGGWEPVYHVELQGGQRGGWGSWCLLCFQEASSWGPHSGLGDLLG